jgi:taurine dioxygenase
VDLIVARGQELTLEQQFAFMANFGPTLEYKDFNSVSTDRESGYLGATALPFHSDGAFSPFPLEAISLHAVDVVDGASSTRFASGVRTLERMPDTLRTALADRETVHVLPLHVDRRNRASDVPPAFPRAQHPAIVTDPQTGKEAVFMCEEMLDGIVGLTQQESDALVDAVFALHHAEDNVVEQRWHRGDLVIWNNLLVQHARGDLGNAGRRTLQRAVGPHGPMDFAGELDVMSFPSATGT